MSPVPVGVAAFLAGKRFAVVGVSRQRSQPANAILRKLEGAGYEVAAVNPNASLVEGRAPSPDVRSVPGRLDGVVFAAPPSAALGVVRQCAERGVPLLWFHRSFGTGSVSAEAVQEAETRGIRCLVGGCPLMYCPPVDPLHKCFRWWLRLGGKVPG